MKGLYAFFHQSGFAILLIKNTFAQGVNFEVVDMTAEKKARKVNFDFGVVHQFYILL